MNRTRSTWKCPLFGDLSDLKCNVLPTYEDVMKFYEWSKHTNKRSKETNKEPTFKELVNIVALKIEHIWSKASIPTVQLKRIKSMLKNYHLKCKKIMKSYPKIPQKRLEEFLCNSKVLFDIAACKCKNINECNCPWHKKVPRREKSFLMDQRTTRRMFIGSVDIAATNIIKKTLKRKEQRRKS